MVVDERRLTERAARIDTLLDDIESFPDPAVRAGVTEIVQSLLALYGEGLTRMLDLINEQADVTAIERLLGAFSNDELISHLLLLHDLHPLSVEIRVARALEEVRPYLQSHGGNVQLVGIEGGVARLKLQGSCSGCPASSMTLKLAIEEAIHKAAPDLEGIEAEGVVEQPSRPVAFLPMSELQGLKRKSEPEPAWTAVGSAAHFPDRELRPRQVEGVGVLFVKLEDTMYAYRNGCPDCSAQLEEGTLRGADLTCGSCRHVYDLRRAGRCLDSPTLYLQPVPLLVQEDIVRIALNGGS